MRLEGDAWRRFFDSFEREAFRLETLPAYGVPAEDEELRSYLVTGQLAIPDGDPWLVRVRGFRASGRRVGRVHVLRKPLTDYLRYEFAVYAHTVRAGEDVRILDLDDHHGIVVSNQDFWLFDEARVVRMDYDAHGRQLGRELLDGVDPAPFVEVKQRLLELAVPFTEYRATILG